MSEPTPEELAAVRDPADYDAAPLVKKPAPRVTYMPDITRALPAAPDAEKGVLCSFLLAPRDVGYLCAEKGVAAETFHMPAHATIYGAMQEMWDKNLPIDFITLTSYLRDKGVIDTVGGSIAVTELFSYLPTAANAAYYIDIITEKHTLRSIIKTGTDFASKGYDDQQDPHTTLDAFEQAVLAIRSQRTTARSQTAQQAVMAGFARIQEAFSRKGAVSGIPTGFAELDMMTDGLHGQELLVIAARPTMGKTAFAMNIAEHMAIELKLPIAVFSLEMGTEQLSQRMICSRARVNLTRVRRGDLVEDDFPRLTQAANEISASKIFFEEGSDTTIQELRARARRLKALHGIQAIFIDSLSVLRSGSKSAQENRHREVAEATNGCKEMAKELNIPVILIAHLGRKAEDRFRPRLSDLRESGNIEQDADRIYFIDRPEERADTPEARLELAGIAELYVAKQRSGPQGEVPLTYLKDITRFESRKDEPQEVQPTFDMEEYSERVGRKHRDRD